MSISRIRPLLSLISVIFKYDFKSYITLKRRRIFFYLAVRDSLPRTNSQTSASRQRVLGKRQTCGQIADKSYISVCQDTHVENGLCFCRSYTFGHLFEEQHGIKDTK